VNPFPATDYVVAFVFTVSVVATVAGALIAVLSTRIIRSVCGLAICCFGLAGLYYFLHSPFLTLMEILIYVGAICVTIIFAVMLAEPDEAPSRETRVSAMWWGGCALVVSGGAFWGISRLGLNHHWAAPAAKVKDGTVKDIGVSLLTTYSLAFELISLALLVAILGALVIARYGRTKP
jgi:NADH:ubiquinone oxidoreductase subunit 6 (subunit J)